ncbi:MAG TPA: hypothetical protein PKK31_01370 [Elusimicrobiales bacterium]|nr:hypothetical protein [Elusimicrobiales bacterium]
MKKVFRPIRFSLTPFVGVLLLLAVLAAYGAFVSYIHGEIHDCLGRVIALAFLSFLVFVSSGDYRGAPILELDDTSLKVGDDFRLAWKDVSDIRLMIYDMTPVLSIESAEGECFIPIDGYSDKFSLMQDIATRCGHLSWHPPQRGTYFWEKCSAIILSIGIILALLLAIAGGIWLAQRVGLGWAGMIGGMIFACGAVILCSGFWIKKTSTFLRIRIDWLVIAVGAVFMAGAIFYAGLNNSAVLVYSMTTIALLMFGVVQYRKNKRK